MSVYNGSRYLQESVESVLNQTFTDFEFIIINDCSTDNTENIIREYSDKDERIVLINNLENLGLTKSLNKGLKIAKGEYIARQDADDISLPERLEKELLFIEEHLDVALVSCDIEVIDSDGFSIRKLQRSCASSLVDWYLLFYNHLAGHSQIMFLRNLVMNLGGYSESFRYSQDYELWCRIARVAKIAILPDVLLKQRFHSQSISAEKRFEQQAYVLSIIKHNIGQLIDKEISLEEAKILNGFWLGHWWSNCFPDSQKVNLLNSRLKEIYQAYTQQKFMFTSLDNHESRKLRKLIGSQFISWINSLSIRHSFMAKIRISNYAIGWHPIGLAKFWLFDFWLFDLSKSIARLIIFLIFKDTSKIKANIFWIRNNLSNSKNNYKN